MSHGKVNALAGATGAGKTSFIKNRYCANAGNREIHVFCRITDDFKDIPRVHIYTNFGEFIRVVSRKKNIIAIVDEAVTCLPKKLEPKIDNPNHLHNLLYDILVNARKLNNFIFFLFQAFRQMVAWLVDYLNYVIAFQTNDQFNYQANRFRSFPKLAEFLEGDPITENFVKQTIKIR